jgi:hypothetical protein
MRSAPKRPRPGPAARKTAHVEREKSGHSQRPLARRLTAKPHAPGARLGDEIGVAGEDSAAWDLEGFIERYVDAVEQRGDLFERPVVCGLRFPEPGAVETSGCAHVSSQCDLVLKIGPARLFAADLALGQLPYHGAERL